MSVQVKRRRNTATNVATFTPAQGELIVDTTNNRVIVGDGATVGGWPAAKLSEVALVARRAVSDANTTIASTDRVVAYTALTAARVVTLCAAASYPTGAILIVVDETGNCSATNTITINRAGSDTIAGLTSAVLNGAYMSSLLESDGVSKWTPLANDINEEFALLGIGTAPDPNNPLSVYGGTNGAALFNGSNFSFTLNKSAAANIASIIFEDSFSLRAQMGLLNSDNFTLKVSPNGSSYYTGLSIDSGTGSVTLGNMRTAVSDASYTALATDRLIAYVAITAARAVTLCAASAFPAGTCLRVCDESGSCSATNTITVSRAGSDTINGAASYAIAAAYGGVDIESNGVNAWTILAPSFGTSGYSVPLLSTANAWSGKQTMPASASGGASINLPAGTAPTTPANGDLWTTSAGLYAQINGGTQHFATFGRTAVADANYSALATDREISYTATTAARTVTLPSAGSFPTGQALVVVDESGSVGVVNSITISRAGSDTISGQTSAAIVSPYGHCRLFSNGSNGWVVAGRSVNIQTFSASGTYKPTPGMAKCDVFLIGGGGGGGGGALQAASAACSGGSGGGAGGVAEGTLTAAQIGASQTITIGVGGTAGAAASASSTAGGTGGNGSFTSFGSFLKALPGSGGAGGQLAGNSGGGGGGGLIGASTAGSGATAGGAATGGSAGGSGAASGVVTNPGGGTGGGGGVNGAAGAISGNDSFGPTGGGAGGGISAANATFAGGNAGFAPTGATYQNAAGGAAGAAGTAGVTPAVAPGFVGTGGGGGGSATSGAAGVGGAGGLGGGGGGGGSGQNGGTAAAGGAGGAGYGLILEYF